MLILIVDRKADHRINIVIHEQHELIKAIHNMLQEQNKLTKNIETMLSHNNKSLEWKGVIKGQAMRRQVPMTRVIILF